MSSLTVISETRHSTVYGAAGTFAGWPANHGAWQWGDEFLVGFMRGPYERRPRTHQIGQPFEKMLARSTDGGRTWRTERPDVDFEAVRTTPAEAFDIGSDIIRVCGVYDHGGDDCESTGGFYVSSDRGQSWRGAFAFDGLTGHFSNPYECSSRTSVLSGRGLVFLTRRLEGRFGTDAAFVAEHNGEGFRLRGVICDDGQRAAMPAVADLGKRIVVALRRSDFQRYWIEAFGSDDDGATWRSLAHIANTSNRNGNPPALIASGGVLYCAYGDRDAGAIRVAISRDGGYSWPKSITIRTGGKSDIGYPQLFRRSDGDLVCVYYWADKAPGDHQRIEATVFRP